jgi:hypothetical protein
VFQFKKSSRKSSSRKQIDILGAKENVLILSANRYRMILEVSAVNFELKSESEQDALIDAYESFLNSIACPLQFLIRTREIDIEKYLADLDERLEGETHAIYKDQLNNYEEFIRCLVSANKILTRHFYIVVPFEESVRNLEFSIIKEQLNLDVDIVSKGLAKLGMHSRLIPSLEIIRRSQSFSRFRFRPRNYCRRHFCVRRHHNGNN